MNTSWFQSLVMGFVSGLAELLPISAEAHLGILCTLFGIESADGILRFGIHLACLIVLLRVNREQIDHLRRTNQLMNVPTRRRKTNLDQRAVYTIRLFRSATVLVVIGKIFADPLSFIARNPAYLAITLLINGVLLYIPGFLPAGNKDSRNMPRLDGILMGLGAGLSVIPGLSLVGASLSLGTARGVDRRFALDFAWLLLIPGLAMDLIVDLVAIAEQAPVFNAMVVISTILGAVAAAFGAWLAMILMKVLSQRTGFTGFAYYSWGMALFSFVLFLMI